MQAEESDQECAMTGGQPASYHLTQERGLLIIHSGQQTEIGIVPNRDIGALEIRQWVCNSKCARKYWGQPGHLKSCFGGH